jgi:hypothetical protein
LQLLGSDATVPDMFPVAVQLNDYVCELQRNGKLEEKPVVYDIYTTVEPVVMRDRLVVVHRDRFSVFERDKCIKSLPAPDIFWTGQTLRNDNSNIKIHSDRLNIHYSESLVDFSYSYSRNRLYRTD